MEQEYKIEADGVPVTIKVTDETEDYVPRYFIEKPELEEPTKAYLTEVKEKLITEVTLTEEEYISTSKIEEVKEKFTDSAEQIIEATLPSIKEEEKQILVGNLIHELLGIGDLEILLADENLEEIVINSAEEPAWTYHKKHGWVKTDLKIGDEDEIKNYASIIGRRVGKQISNLNPLLDAHLPSGDRTNATITPISTQGNTITIRKFARDPWTITDFIKNGTVNTEISALLWLAIQYEMNILVSGGTGSGKTSLLGVLLPFIPPNQRIVSIEDTREVSLPEFLHWVPLTTREPNPEGKGGVSMLDLLVNSLRMRPDRIIVGEIRTEKQAEVLFEAMHTGHSVYSTLHADTAMQTIRRLKNPPINVPKTLIEAIDLNVVMFRDRRRNLRRAMQVAEVMSDHIGEKTQVKPNVLYSWSANRDKIEKKHESQSLYENLRLHAGLEKEEIEESLKDRRKILNWMVENEINQVNTVGKVIAEFYQNEERVVGMVEDDVDPEELYSL